MDGWTCGENLEDVCNVDVLCTDVDGCTGCDVLEGVCNKDALCTNDVEGTALWMFCTQMM